MIVVRNWRRWNRKTYRPMDYKGIFLFGIIPLFIYVHNSV